MVQKRILHLPSHYLQLWIWKMNQYWTINSTGLQSLRGKHSHWASLEEVSKVLMRHRELMNKVVASPGGGTRDSSSGILTQLEFKGQHKRNERVEDSLAVIFQGHLGPLFALASGPQSSAPQDVSPLWFPSLSLGELCPECVRGVFLYSPTSLSSLHALSACALLWLFSFSSSHWFFLKVSPGVLVRFSLQKDMQV